MVVSRQASLDMPLFGQRTWITAHEAPATSTTTSTSSPHGHGAQTRVRRPSSPCLRARGPEPERRGPAGGAAAPPPPLAEPSPFRFRLMSYNVLSDQYAQHFSHILYKDVPKHCLPWSYRLPLLLREMLFYSPDVICLQEVTRFDDLQQGLRPAGYEGVYMRRAGRRRDGCAVFWRTSRLALLPGGTHTLDFVDLGLEDNVALLLHLQPLPDAAAGGAAAAAPAASLLVATTHICFDPNKGDVKLGQVRQLVALVDAHARRTRWPGAVAVIAGDFNMVPRCPIYEFLSQGHLNLAEHSKRRLSGQVKGFGHPHYFAARERQAAEAAKAAAAAAAAAAAPPVDAAPRPSVVNVDLRNGALELHATTASAAPVPAPAPAGVQLWSDLPTFDPATRSTAACGLCCGGSPPPLAPSPPPAASSASPCASPLFTPSKPPCPPSPDPALPTLPEEQPCYPSPFGSASAVSFCSEVAPSPAPSTSSTTPQTDRASPCSAAAAAPLASQLSVAWSLKSVRTALGAEAVGSCDHAGQQPMRHRNSTTGKLNGAATPLPPPSPRAAAAAAARAAPPPDAGSAAAAAAAGPGGSPGGAAYSAPGSAGADGSFTSFSPPAAAAEGGLPRTEGFAGNGAPSTSGRPALHVPDWMPSIHSGRGLTRRDSGERGGGGGAGWGPHSTSLVASHLLRLNSAYCVVQGDEPLFTSVHSEFIGACDYIFYTPEGSVGAAQTGGATGTGGLCRHLSMGGHQWGSRDSSNPPAAANGVDGWPRVPVLRPVAVLAPPPLESLRGGLPAPGWGSDHVSVVCDFVLE